MKKLLFLFIALGCLPFSRAHADITFAQSNDVNNGAIGSSSINLAFNSNVGTGNLIAGSVYWANTGQTLNQVTDTCGNTYNIVGSGNTAGIFIYYGFYAANVNGGACTVTATFSGSGFFRAIMILHEIRGADKIAPLDGNTSSSLASTPAGTDALTTGSFTTNNNGDYIFGTLIDQLNINATITAGTNFTRRISDIADHSITSEDRIQAKASSTTVVSFTNSGNSGAAIIGLAFKPAPVHIRLIIHGSGRPGGNKVSVLRIHGQGRPGGTGKSILRIIGK